MTPSAPRTMLLTAGGKVLVNRALIRVGLRRRVDGWRRAAGLMLRTEASTFVLSAFGLDACGGRVGGLHGAGLRAHVAERLTGFLNAQPVCCRRVRHAEFEDSVEPAARAAFTLAFEPRGDGPARFLAPSSWDGEPQEGPDGVTDGALLNVVCRLSERGAADVWLRVNHVGADGVPIQDMLNRLEAEWGLSEEVRFPTPEAFAPLAEPRPIAGGSELREIQMFADFSPLVRWRKQENGRLPEPMTLAAAVLWALARQPALAGLQMGTTVEVSERYGLERGVGVVVVRPADYFGRADGLCRYVRRFNRELDRTRRRASASCKTLDAAALIDPRSAGSLLRHALQNVPGAFGDVALTMLKDGKVFGAPIAEVGHARGFIAIGSVALPSADGRQVGCITVKGPASVVATYPSIIRDAIDRCGEP